MAKVRKALMAAATAAGAAVVTAAQDGAVTSAEWVTVAVAAVVAGLAVWRVPNAGAGA